MLAEILQDDKSTFALQASYKSVGKEVKKIENKMAEVRREVNATLVQIQRERDILAQREQQLLLYAAQQNIDIPVKTGQALLESTIVLLTPSEPDIRARQQNIIGHGESAVHAYDIIVQDDDIESDEDRLQAELG
ncbi:hypothetical protein DM02DRAFT_277107 [Periconia macrospinosa]|uniref:Uncharacterized protein n=1 Tax=Periconia macrospinosa TaxID=97972 RepID=A0A2V1D317_9PLEO|nr:hypothetical protein DM02DRAFT_277107 [Periconia macrospinosa]